MKSPHSICFINTSINWGGGEKWHVETANYMAERGHKVYFIHAANATWKDKLNPRAIQMQEISISSLSFLNPFKLLSLRRFFVTNSIHTVVLNGSAELKTAGLAAWFAQVPDIIYRRGLAKAPKGNGLNHFFFRRVVSRFIVNSQQTQLNLLQNFRIKPQELNIHVLYNGLRIPKTFVESDQINDPILLGNAARLVHQKGHDLLMDAVIELRKHTENFRVEIAGTGALEKELKDRVEAEGLSHHIHFLGFVEEMTAFMQRIDIYLHPSRFEGFGFSIAEAMLHHKPVVAFNTSSNPELIETGKTGLLVEPFNTGAFAQSMLNLMTDKAMRKQIGENGFAYAKENFEQNQQHRKFEELVIAQAST